MPQTKIACRRCGRPARERDLVWNGIEFAAECGNACGGLVVVVRGRS